MNSFYSSIYKKSKWIDSTQQEQLLKEFFSDDCPVIIDWDFHNSQKIVDGKIVIGPWAGPYSCISNLIHEMCHLVEIDDKRILQPSWGLKLPPGQYIPGYGMINPEPKDIRPILRECRVIAMQWQLENYLGMGTTPKEAVSSLEFMQDFVLINCNKDLPYREWTSGRLKVIKKMMIRYSRGKYTLDFFRKEWKRKIELLKGIK